MKLTYLGNELNPDKEHELITDHKFGFAILVKYKESSSYYEQHKRGMDTFNNCHEVHWMYNLGNPDPTIRVAFESNIHSTGGTRSIDHFESIEITLADKEDSNW